MTSQTEVSATRAIATQQARSARPQRRVARWLNPRVWGPTAVVFVIVALLWQLVAVTNPYVLPTLGDVAASLLEDPAMYWENFLITLQEVVVGAGAAIVLGYLLAVIMSEFEIVERAVMPLIILIMVTPVIAIAPALVVAFGFGMMPKYIVTGIVVFF
ncbi:MAG TPA: ABC transporter permease, partial [Microterricola sp.]